MSCSPLHKKSRFQARSNSLPCRPHPLVSQIDEHICRLRATEATPSSISNNINGLADLYDLVNSVLLLPHSQEVLTQDCNEKLVDEVLDWSLRLMDVSGTAKDAFLQMKEDTQELQSAMRRRRGDESRLVIDIDEYLSSKKKANKVIRKSFKDLKSTCTFSSLKDETIATITLLREVEDVTLIVFESLFSYTSGSKAHAKPCGWSLVSELMHKKHLQCENETGISAFDKVDAALYTLIGHKTRTSDQSLESALKILKELELRIQDLEEGLECLLRRLIKTRVSLLNIINH